MPESEGREAILRQIITNKFYVKFMIYAIIYHSFLIKTRLWKSCTTFTVILCKLADLWNEIWSRLATRLEQIGPFQFFSGPFHALFPFHCPFSFILCSQFYSSLCLMSLILSTTLSFYSIFVSLNFFTTLQ